MYRTIQYIDASHDCYEICEDARNKGEYTSLIDELKGYDYPWDYDTEDITEDKPKLANYDTYLAEVDGYTLIYNNTIGGCYMLYREATEQEEEEAKK